MKLLNSKSILNCNTEDSEKKHNQEIKYIIEQLTTYPDYDCAVVIKYFDEANQSKKSIIKHCKLYNCIEMIMAMAAF